MKTQKVFVATPMTAVYGEFGDSAARDFMNDVAQLLVVLRRKWRVFCAFEPEEWGDKRPTKPADAEDILKRDLDELSSADLLVAIFNQYPSSGVCIEIGAQLSRAKPIIVLRGEGNELPFLIGGLRRFPFCRELSYRQLTDSNLEVALFDAIGALTGSASRPGANANTLGVAP